MCALWLLNSLHILMTETIYMLNKIDSRFPVFFFENCCGTNLTHLVKFIFRCIIFLERKVSLNDEIMHIYVNYRLVLTLSPIVVKTRTRKEVNKKYLGKQKNNICIQEAKSTLSQNYYFLVLWGNLLKLLSWKNSLSNHVYFKSATIEFFWGIESKYESLDFTFDAI